MSGKSGGNVLRLRIAREVSKGGNVVIKGDDEAPYIYCTPNY